MIKKLSIASYIMLAYAVGAGRIPIFFAGMMAIILAILCLAERLFDE
ncbi:MAG: hypothetical protein PHD70_14240 [Anaerostipes sp.]|nr:hypothetical protein [Anaerostipes sp.]MDD4372263.1 hypothetical protein [Anaerostipes sp.]